MKKILIIIVLGVLSFSFSSSSLAGWFSENLMEEADKFIKARMFDKAGEKLEEEINENPTNAEAHIQLGIIYQHSNNHEEAKKRFASAYALNKDYGPEIAKILKSTGDIYLKRGFISKAIYKYREVLYFNISVQDDIDMRCFKKMLFYLSTSKIVPSSPSIASDAADKLEAFILEHNQEYGKKINKAQRAYAHSCLQIAISKPKKEARPYLTEAKKYLRSQDIKAIIPPSTWQPPPRNTDWMRVVVKPGEPQRLIRAYNGDQCEYVSFENFMIIEGYGTKEKCESLHNKSSEPREVRIFPFYNIAKEGVDVYILGLRDVEFTFKYRIIAK